MRRDNGRRGSILVMVILLMGAIAVLSLALTAMVRAFHGEQTTSREELAARYVAEAGLGEALVQLRLGADGNLGSEQAPVAYGASSYWVSATDLGGQRTALEATGVDDRARARIEVVLESQPAGFFRWGAFADDRLVIDSNARIDSYDSGDGTYASQVSGNGNSAHAHEEGHIGSNGPISMDSNTKVWGDATPGVSSSVTLSGNSIVSGSTIPRTAPLVLPPLAVPAGGPGANSTINGTQNRASGTYFYNTLTLDSNSILNVTGPAVIVVNNLTANSNSQIRVNAADGGVTLYINKKFELNSNAQIYSLTKTPADVSINLGSTPTDTVKFDSNTQLWGTVYAPKANIKIDSNAEIYGSIASWRLELNSNSRIHYDTALARQGAVAGGNYEVISWRVLEH